MKVFRFNKGRWEEEKRVPPSETTLTIYLNSKELATLATTPGSERELVAGFLFTESIIEGIAELKTLQIDESGNAWVETFKDVPLAEAKKKILTSGCGKGISFKGNLKGLKKVKKKTYLPPYEITEFVRKCQVTSKLYRAHGGIHSAALLTSTGSIFLREDIGRHNALDKAIGAYLQEMSGVVVASFATGRLSSEMVSKSIRAGAEFCFSMSSPTDLAIMLAERYEITLAGYVRGSSFTIYSHPERVAK